MLPASSSSSGSSSSLLEPTAQATNKLFSGGEFNYCMLNKIPSKINYGSLWRWLRMESEKPTSKPLKEAMRVDLGRESGDTQGGWSGAWSFPFQVKQNVIAKIFPWGMLLFGRMAVFCAVGIVCMSGMRIAGCHQPGDGNVELMVPGGVPIHLFHDVLH